MLFTLAFLALLFHIGGSSATRPHSQTLEHARNRRDWKTNDLRVWGKRTGLGREDLEEEEERDEERGKRDWKTNDLRVWGKRQSQTVPARVYRGTWDTNALRVWGKRSIPEVGQKKWDTGNMQVWGKRQLELALEGSGPNYEDWEEQRAKEVHGTVQGAKLGEKEEHTSGSSTQERFSEELKFQKTAPQGPQRSKRDVSEEFGGSNAEMTSSLSRGLQDALVLGVWRSAQPRKVLLL